MKSKIILIFLILVIAGVTGYFYWTKQITGPTEQAKTIGTPHSQENNISSQKKCPPAHGATLQCGSLVVSPITINAETSTQISASILILESNMPQRIVLERLDKNGKVIATIGNFKEMGIGGDLMRGGSPEFGIEFILNEPYPSFIRLRAYAIFQGLLTPLYTEDRYISVIPSVKADSELEIVVTGATEMLFTTKSVNDLRVYFNEVAFSQLENSVKRSGISALKDYYGPAFKTATLDFKTDRTANFSITYLINGVKINSTLELEKFSGGWKIISF